MREYQKRGESILLLLGAILYLCVSPSCRKKLRSIDGEDCTFSYVSRTLEVAPQVFTEFVVRGESIQSVDDTLAWKVLKDSLAIDYPILVDSFPYGAHLMLVRRDSFINHIYPHSPSRLVYRQDSEILFRGSNKYWTDMDRFPFELQGLVLDSTMVDVGASLKVEYYDFSDFEIEILSNRLLTLTIDGSFLETDSLPERYYLLTFLIPYLCEKDN